MVSVCSTRSRGLGLPRLISVLRPCLFLAVLLWRASGLCSLASGWVWLPLCLGSVLLGLFGVVFPVGLCVSRRGPSPGLSSPRFDGPLLWVLALVLVLFRSPHSSSLVDSYCPHFRPLLPLRVRGRPVSSVSCLPPNSPVCLPLSLALLVRGTSCRLHSPPSLASSL